jgi:hypothetical protein
MSHNLSEIKLDDRVIEKIHLENSKVKEIENNFVKLKYLSLILMDSLNCKE